MARKTERDWDGGQSQRSQSQSRDKDQRSQNRDQGWSRQSNSERQSSYHARKTSNSTSTGFSDEAKRNRMYKLLSNVDIQIKKNFKWDEEGLWSFTNYDIGLRMASMLLEVPGVTLESCITDCMSSIGGNTIPFAQTFKSVNAIELNPTRFTILEHNLSLFKLDNVTMFNGHFQTFLTSLPPTIQNIIYLDPPWGSDYKKHESLRLTIGNEDGSRDPLEDIICAMRTKASVVMVKLPRNYDMSHFQDQTCDSFKIVKEENYNPPNSMKIVILVVVE